MPDRVAFEQRCAMPVNKSFNRFTPARDSVLGCVANQQSGMNLDAADLGDNKGARIKNLLLLLWDLHHTGAARGRRTFSEFMKYVDVQHASYRDSVRVIIQRSGFGHLFVAQSSAIYVGDMSNDDLSWLASQVESCVGPIALGLGYNQIPTCGALLVAKMRTAGVTIERLMVILTNNRLNGIWISLQRRGYGTTLQPSSAAAVPVTESEATELTRFLHVPADCNRARMEVRKLLLQARQDAVAREFEMGACPAQAPHIFTSKLYNNRIGRELVKTALSAAGMRKYGDDVFALLQPARQATVNVTAVTPTGIVGNFSSFSSSSAAATASMMQQMQQMDPTWDPSRWESKKQSWRAYFVGEAPAGAGKDVVNYIVPELRRHTGALLRLDCFKHLLCTLRVETPRDNKFVETLLDAHPYVAPFVRACLLLLGIRNEWRDEGGNRAYVTQMVEAAYKHIVVNVGVHTLVGFLDRTQMESALHNIDALKADAVEVVQNVSGTSYAGDPGSLYRNAALLASFYDNEWRRPSCDELASLFERRVRLVQLFDKHRNAVDAYVKEKMPAVASDRTVFFVKARDIETSFHRQVGREAADHRVDADEASAMQDNAWIDDWLKTIRIKPAERESFKNFMDAEGYDDKPTTKCITFKQLCDQGFREGVAHKIKMAIEVL